MLFALPMRSFLVVSASIAALNTSAFAQALASAVPGVPGISCYMAPLKLSDADIVSFLGRSNDDLASFASAGLPLSTRVRMLAASDVRTLAPILARVQAVAPGASAQPAAGQPATSSVADPSSGTTPTGVASSAPAVDAAVPGQPSTSVVDDGQMKAIADGLAAAAIACSTSGNELGTLIQEGVAKTNNEPFIQAFVAALENQNQRQQLTAALGARGAVSAPAATIGNDGVAGSQSGLGRDEATPTVSGEFGVLWDARYFSENGAGGSEDNQISPTSP